jgi:predicted ABC-type transport system involved in lysophospholipase L1 biosynthesis ATPase subunit
MKLLASLNLGHRLNSYPSALSDDEAQRVAIARALANLNCSPRDLSEINESDGSWSKFWVYSH